MPVTTDDRKEELKKRDWWEVDGDHWAHLEMEMVYTFEQACRMENIQ